MFIDKLIVKNFKGFESITIPFEDRFTVVVGNNGMGKSSVLDALSVAASCFLNPMAGGKKYQRMIEKNEVRLRSLSDAVFEPQFPCVVTAERCIEDEVKMSWYRSVESEKYTNTTKGVKQIADEALSLFERARQDEPVILPLLAYHGTGRLWDELNDNVAFVKQGSRLEGYDYCFSAKSSSKDFRKWYKTLEDSANKRDSDELRQRLDVFRKAVMACISDWDNIFFDFSEDDIVLEKMVDGVKQQIPFRMMSDGYRNMIAMVADLAYRCIKLNPHLKENAVKETPGLVLIDELDMHLHPIWQRRVVEELSKGFPLVQFVATTHSPFIVQSLAPEQIYNIEQTPLLHDPRKMSLEASALYMGVESVRGKNFSDKEQAAMRFMKLLDNPKEYYTQQQMSKVIDDYLVEFSSDPAFVAQLKYLQLKKKYGL